MKRGMGVCVLTRGDFPRSPRLSLGCITLNAEAEKEGCGRTKSEQSVNGSTYGFFFPVGVGGPGPYAGPKV